MTANKWVPRLIPGAVVAALALLLVPVQNRVDAVLVHPTVDPDLLYFSSPALVKSLALGYEGVLADLYWMRAIQYYGRRDEAERRQVPYKNLASLIDIVVTLDPDMIDVYRAGAVFLSEAEPIGAGKPQSAIQLLEKGIAAHPEDWHLLFDKGFVYFWYLKDYRQAGQSWLEGSRIPEAPPWFEALAARGLSQGGAVETAKDLWRRQLENAARDDVKANARNHLASIRVDEDLWTLEFLIAKYHAARGSFPPRLETLVAAGYLKYIPEDPSGVPYQYDPLLGGVRLSTGTKVKYLKLPYDYRETFKAKLAQLFDPGHE